MNSISLAYKEFFLSKKMSNQLNHVVNFLGVRMSNSKLPRPIYNPDKIRRYPNLKVVKSPDGTVSERLLRIGMEMGLKPKEPLSKRTVMAW